MDFTRYLVLPQAPLLLVLIGLMLPDPVARAQGDATTEPHELKIAMVVRREGEYFSVNAIAELRVTRAQAWAVLTDYEHYADFVPEIDSSRVVSRTGNSLVLDQKGRMSFLFFSQPVDVRLAVVETPPALVASRALSGNLRDFSGRYVIAETAGGVRIEHSARFLPEFEMPPLLGPIVVRSVLERNFTALLQEMQRRAALRLPARAVPPAARAVPTPPSN